MTDPSAPGPRGVPDAKRVIEIFAVVIAPVTALTSLLGYVGWIRNRAFFDYFGVEQGLLNLSIQDYVLRSSDVTFGAVARLVAALVVLALGDRVLARVQRNTDPGAGPQQPGARGRRLAQALAVTGLVLSLAGLLLALGLGTSWGLPALLGPAVLGVGSIVTFDSGGRWSPRRPNLDCCGRSASRHWWPHSPWRCSGRRRCTRRTSGDGARSRWTPARSPFPR